jgi:O-antigen/teichoic acid export membrane protein
MTGPVPVTATSRYVRGSSLLFAGRCCSLAVNCLVQVLIVRYLAKEQYGAFAYALATVTLISTVILCGLGKALPRVVAVHVEREEHERAFGSVALALGSVLLTGVLVVAVVRMFGDAIGRGASIPPEVLPVLWILIIAAPLDALDHLLQHLAAIFCGARTIFLRRHLVGPLLRLGAIAAVIAFSGTVTQLAYAYVSASAAGVTLYLWALLRQWQVRGLLRHLHPVRLQLPIRELFGFSLPLASSDLAVALRASVAVLILGYLGTLHDVAEYRAVLPIAGLNMIAAETFAFLFVPAASRLFARGDAAAMNGLYWHSSLWIAVLTLPVFAVTFALASPLVTTVLGAQYAAAAPVLSVLSIGYYINAAMGFNAAMLRVTGALRTIVGNDLVTSVACVGVTAALASQFGAVGTSATFVIYNLLNYFGLGNRGDLKRPEGRITRVFAGVAVAALAVMAVMRLFAPPLVPGIVIAGLASIAVLRLSRHVLDLHVTFPELLRVPVLRWLVR